MPITPINVETSHIDADQEDYLTSSKTPTANRLQLLWVRGKHGASVQTITVSGCNLNWEEVLSVNFGTTDRMTLFRAVGASPTTGQLTIHFTALMVLCWWMWIEFTGTEISNNGAGAIVQSNSVSTNGTNATISLNAFRNAIANAAVGGFASGSSSGMTVGSGFSSVSSDSWNTTHPGHELVEYKIGEDTTVNVNNASFKGITGIAVEISVPLGGSGGGGQGQGKGTGGGVSGGGGNAFGKGKDRDHGKDKGGGSGPPGTIDKILVGSRSRRRKGTL